MKKVLLTLICGFSLLLTSCDGKDPVSTRTIGAEAYNLVINGDGKVSVVSSQYRFLFDNIAHTAEMSFDFTVDGKNYKGNTNPTSFKQYIYNGGAGDLYKMNSLNAGKTSDGLAISNLNVDLTSLIYLPPVLQGVPNASVQSLYGLIAQYKLGGDVSVKTFLSDVTFIGKTTTNYQMGPTSGNYETETIYYRLAMNLKDLNKPTANLYIYNGKFSSSEKEPVKTCILLADLPLKFNSAGYDIDVENVVPQLYEAGQFTKNEKFIFNNIRLTSINEMKKCVIEFKVAGIYNGSFEGSSLVETEVENPK